MRRVLVDLVPFDLPSISTPHAPLLALLCACSVVTACGDDAVDPAAPPSSTDSTTTVTPQPTGSNTGPVAPTPTPSVNPSPTTTTVNPAPPPPVSSTSAPPVSSTTSNTSSTTAPTPTTEPAASSSEPVDSSETPGDVTSDEPSNPGGPAEAEPTAGCGKANPQTGSSGAPLDSNGHKYYVKLPQNYDPNTPYPVVIMFNPTGNPHSWAEQEAGFESTASSWIRVYPDMGNRSSGWNPQNDGNFFGPFYEQITNNYCMDKNRIFAAGESSGGDIVGYLGCAHADKLRGIGPGAPKVVGGWPLNAGQANCTGQVHATIIYSESDKVLAQPSGGQMTTYYKTLNHCGDATTPVQGYTDSMSNCAEYQGCDEGYSTIVCKHQDPHYRDGQLGDTFHGWPRFAARMLIETWSKL